MRISVWEREKEAREQVYEGEREKKRKKKAWGQAFEWEREVG